MSEVEKEIDVLERVWKPKRVLAAWRQVKKNAGAAGIDQMSVDEFAEHKTELLRGAIAKLRDGTYRFKPARRVLIPKPGKPGKFRNSVRAAGFSRSDRDITQSTGNQET